MPDEPNEPGVLAELPEVPVADADAAAEQPAVDALSSLPVPSSGPPAAWLEKVRRHAPGLLLGGPPMRAAMPDSYPRGAPTVEFDDSTTRIARPDIDRWRFAEADPARHEGQPPLRFEEPVTSSRLPTGAGGASLVEPPLAVAPAGNAPVDYSGGSVRATDPEPAFDEPAVDEPRLARSPAQPSSTERTDARSNPYLAPVFFDDHQPSAARAALSDAGALTETPPMPERRVESWPEKFQDGDVKPDGPAQPRVPRVPRVVTMSRPIRPAGIEWPAVPPSTRRPSAVTLSPAARVPEPPAAFGAVVQGRDPWPTLPPDPPPDVFEVAASLRERERRARLFREQEGA